MTEKPFSLESTLGPHQTGSSGSSVKSSHPGQEENTQPAAPGFEGTLPRQVGINAHRQLMPMHSDVEAPEADLRQECPN